MKKLLVLMVGIMMAFSLAACGGDDTADNSAADDTQQEEVQDEEPLDDGSDEELSDAEIGGLEKGFSFLDMGQVETPAADGTPWSFAGGYLNDNELDNEEATAVLQQYGGTLQFVFNEDGTAQMVQGGGTLEGTWTLRDEGGYDVVLDNQGTALNYTCIFVESADSVLMIAIAGDNVTEGIYFAQ